jgi:hypothetical protein
LPSALLSTRPGCSDTGYFEQGALKATLAGFLRQQFVSEIRAIKMRHCRAMALPLKSVYD